MGREIGDLDGRAVTSDSVVMILTCPECATSYFAADSSIGEGRVVRCSACGASWRAEPARPLDLRVEPEAGAIAAEPRTADEELISRHSSELPGDRLPKAFRARAQADRRVREAAVQGVVWAGMGASLALVLVLAIVFRADVVRLWPRAAGAYAAVRLPVNPVGLTIEDVHARPSLQDGHPALIVSGEVRNIRPEAIGSPPLKVVLRDKDGRPLLTRTVDPPDGLVPPGQSRRFSLNLLDPPQGATASDITFASLKARPVATLASRVPAAPRPQPAPLAMTLRPTSVEDAKPLPADSPYALRTKP
jgi:predicted Zn finger-like uncharacterized protein